MRTYTAKPNQRGVTATSLKAGRGTGEGWTSSRCRLADVLDALQGVDGVWTAQDAGGEDNG